MYLVWLIHRLSLILVSVFLSVYLFVHCCCIVCIAVLVPYRANKLHIRVGLAVF